MKFPPPPLLGETEKIFVVILTLFLIDPLYISSLIHLDIRIVFTSYLTLNFYVSVDFGPFAFRIKTH